VVTLLTPRTDPRVLTAFYERVRPFGWWTATARAAGDSPAVPLRALLRQLRTVGVCAASLFLLLVGAGRLAIGPPDTTLVGSLLMLIGGVALTPLWLRELA
jgi:solute:Na+ symporter, SSS family